MNTERPDNDDTTGTSGDVRGVGDAAKGSAEGPAGGGTGVEAGAGSGSTAAGAKAGRSRPDDTEHSVSDVDPDHSEESDPPESGTAAGLAASDAEAGRPEVTGSPARDVDAGQPKATGAAAPEADADQPEAIGATELGQPEETDPATPEPDLPLHAHSPETDDPRPTRSRSPLVIASVAAAVLLVGGGGAYLASSSSSSGGSGDGTGSAASGADGTPPPLALDGYSAGGTGGIAVGEPNPYGQTYRAAGTLPGGPKSAAVYSPEGTVTKDDVARLARALGVVGTPVAEGQYWKVGGQDASGPSLQVNKTAPGMWTFSRYAPGTDDCTGTSNCRKDPAAPASDPVSVAVAKKAAAPILKAVGQDDAKVDASQLMGAQRVVNAEPVIGGLPTHGWTTGLTVSAQGEVVGGSGQLAAPMKGDVYPVLSAQKTLDLMNAAPRTDHRMGIGGCASPVPLKDRLEAPCGQSTDAASASATPASAAVEHAVFGLAVQSVDGEQALVPSWLFEVRQPGGQDTFTVTYPAIDPKYLASANTPTPTASSTATAKPHDVKADGWSADGKSLTVAFTGGVCADYKASAVESSGEVTVTVTATPWPDKICVMIAKVYHQTVQLKAPVGDRKVVGPDGEAIPAEQAGKGAQPTAGAGVGPSLAQ
ncbi:hypothetical protein [Streptomyces prunicolor]